MAAIAVENVDPAVSAAEHDQLLVRTRDGMRLAVAEIAGQPQAVPTASESGRGRRGFDLPNLVGVRLQRHAVVVQPSARLVAGDRPAGREIAVTPRDPRPSVIFVTTARSAHDPCRHPGRDTTVDLLVVGSGTGMAAALAAHECGIDGADRREVVLRRRVDRPVGWRTVVAGQPDPRGEGRRRHHRSGPRRICGGGGRHRAGGAVGRTTCSTSNGDRRHAAADDADSKLAGPRTIPTTTPSSRAEAPPVAPASVDR